MSYARMVETEAELAREVAEWLARAQAEDAAEDAEHGSTRRGGEPPDWMRDKQARLAEAARPAPPRDADGAPKPRPGRPPAHPPGQPKPSAQRNFTDPDSRIMKGRDGFVQAYNAQAAVDADAQIIVAHRLTNHGSDQDALLPLLDTVQDTTGDMPTRCPPTTASVRRPTSQVSSGARCAATWRPVAPASRAAARRAVGWFRPCARGSGGAGIEVDIECGHMVSNPSSDRSNKPELPPVPPPRHRQGPRRMGIDLHRPQPRQAHRVRISTTMRRPQQGLSNITKAVTGTSS